MVNLVKLSTLLAYSLESISYKPIPVVPALHELSLRQNGASSQMHTEELSKSLNQTHKAAQDPGCYVEPYNAPPIDQDFPPFDPSLASIYRYRQQQGVNLGSW